LSFVSFVIENDVAEITDVLPGSEFCVYSISTLV